MPRVRMNRQAGGRLLAGLLGSVAGSGVFQAMRADDRTPPVHLTNEQDRQRLMDLLKITSLRPGRKGSNRADPNYANYDESKANPHPTRPDCLTVEERSESRQGIRLVVETASGDRRGFRYRDQHTFGRRGQLDRSRYRGEDRADMVTPANAKGPVPVILLFSGAGFGFPVTPPIPGAAPAPAGGLRS